MSRGDSNVPKPAMMSDLMKKVVARLAQLTPEERAEFDRKVQERTKLDEMPAEYSQTADGGWLARKEVFVGIGRSREGAFKDLFAKIELHFCPPGAEDVLRRTE